MKYVTSGNISATGTASRLPERTKVVAIESEMVLQVPQTRLSPMPAIGPMSAVRMEYMTSSGTFSPVARSSSIESVMPFTTAPMVPSVL